MATIVERLPLQTDRVAMTPGRGFMEKNMTFVYEPLDEKAAADLEAKVKKFQTVLSMTRAQIVDRARDIVFVGLGGRGETPPQRGEPPNHYAMFWRGSGIAMQGYHEVKGGSAVRITVTLTRLAIPQQLQAELPEIQKAAEQAMALYWGSLHRLPTSVTLRFPAPTYF